MAGVEQNRYKTNNGCVKHLPQTGLSVADCCNVSIILTSKQNGQFQFLSTVVTRMAVT